MSPATDYPHLERRADGKMWLTGTQIKVIEVVLDRLAHHWDAEEIQRNHPHLTLGQIYSCLAYYHDHQEEMDRLIEDQLREVNELRSRNGPSVMAKCGKLTTINTQASVVGRALWRFRGWYFEPAIPFGFFVGGLVGALFMAVGWNPLAGFGVGFVPSFLLAIKTLAANA